MTSVVLLTTSPPLFPSHHRIMHLPRINILRHLCYHPPNHHQFPSNVYLSRSWQHIARKGICFNCNEKYHKGHKYASKVFLLIVEEANELQADHVLLDLPPDKSYLSP